MENKSKIPEDHHRRRQSRSFVSTYEEAVAIADPNPIPTTTTKRDTHFNHIWSTHFAVVADRWLMHQRLVDE